MNRPESVDVAAVSNWTTNEEVRRVGELRAELAREWAAYLEVNGCSFADDC